MSRVSGQYRRPLGDLVELAQQYLSLLPPRGVGQGNITRRDHRGRAALWKRDAGCAVMTGVGGGRRGGYLSCWWASTLPMGMQRLAAKTRPWFKPAGSSSRYSVWHRQARGAVLQGREHASWRCAACTCADARRRISHVAWGRSRWPASGGRLDPALRAAYAAHWPR